MNDCANCDSAFCGLADLTKKQLETFKDNVEHAAFKRRKTIIKCGEDTNKLVYLKSGLVKIAMPGPDGNSEIVKIAKAPNFIGLPSIFGSVNYKCTSTAIDDVKACIMESRVIFKLIEENGKFASNFLKLVCQEQLITFERHINILNKNLYGCVAEALLMFSDLYKDSEFRLSLNNSEIASLIGSSRESVSRVLSDFSKNNIIEIKEHFVAILDKDKLEEISIKG